MTTLSDLIKAGFTRRQSQEILDSIAATGGSGSGGSGSGAIYTENPDFRAGSRASAGMADLTTYALAPSLTDEFDGTGDVVWQDTVYTPKGFDVNAIRPGAEVVRTNGAKPLCGKKLALPPSASKAWTVAAKFLGSAGANGTSRIGGLALFPSGSSATAPALTLGFHLNDNNFQTVLGVSVYADHSANVTSHSSAGFLTASPGGYWLRWTKGAAGSDDLTAEYSLDGGWTWRVVPGWSQNTPAFSPAYVALAANEEGGPGAAGPTGYPHHWAWIRGASK
jgi:hypothetical protein